MNRITRFYHKTSTDDGGFMLLNTYTGKIFKISSDLANRFEKALYEQNFSDIKVCNFLTENKFLINEHVDEDRNAEALYIETINSREELKLIILPTEECNFRCKYCYEFSENEAEHKPRKKMNEKTIQDIKQYVNNEVLKYKSLRIEWFGGEPLEAIDVIEELSAFFISVCHKNKIPYTATMTTNGYGLSLDIFKKLMSLHILSYQITVDGLQDTHDRQRILADNRGTYEVIVNNLIKIRDSIKSRLFFITIRTNITKSVNENIEAHIDFLHKQFANDHRFGVIFKVVWESGRQTDFECREVLESGSLLEILDKCKNKSLRFEMNKVQIGKSGSVCYANQRNSIIIGSDGKLYKCTIAFDDQINYVGNLLSKGKMELFEDRYNFWTTRNPKVDYSRCYRCNIQPICLGIHCPLNSVNKKGELQCTGMKGYMDSYLRLIEEIPSSYKNIQGGAL